VLPIFNKFEGKLYVRSGYYQIPLFQGPVDKQLVDEMKKYNDHNDFLKELLWKRKLTLKDGFSVLVWLLDSQREGHFNDQISLEFLDYRYMPQESNLINWRLTSETMSKLKT